MSEAWLEEEDEETSWRPSRKELRRLGVFVRPWMRLFTTTFVVLLFLFALELLGPWILKNFIDGPYRTRQEGGDVSQATWAIWVGAYALLLVINFALQIVQIILSARAGQGVVRDLRVHLFEHLLHLSPDYFERTQTGRLVTRISSDCENLSELFTTGVVTTVVDVLKIGGLLLACVLVSPTLSIVLLVASPLLVILALLFYGHARRAYRSVRGSLSRQTGWFAEATTGVRVTRLFGQEPLVHARYAELNRKTRQNWIRTVLLFGLFFAFLEFGSGSTQAILLWPASASIPEA